MTAGTPPDLPAPGQRVDVVFHYPRAKGPQRCHATWRDGAFHFANGFVTPDAVIRWQPVETDPSAPVEPAGPSPAKPPRQYTISAAERERRRETMRAFWRRKLVATGEAGS